MEIVRNKNSIAKRYDEVIRGDVFNYGGTIYLKMDTNESVDLSDGTTFEFQPTTEVKIVSARLIITENYWKTFIKILDKINILWYNW